MKIAVDSVKDSGGDLHVGQGLGAVSEAEAGGTGELDSGMGMVQEGGMRWEMTFQAPNWPWNPSFHSWSQDCSSSLSCLLLKTEHPWSTPSYNLGSRSVFSLGGLEYFYHDTLLL